MKYLLILAIFIVVGALIYRRAKPYIKIARHVFGLVSDAQSTHLKQDAGSAREVKQTGGKLVRCAGCGVWLPTSRALVLRHSAALSYCSTVCVERSTKGV